MQFLIKQNEEHVVCNIELVILHLIVGTPIIVFALTILVVSTSILEASFVDS
jgi:hypothetical protein